MNIERTVNALEPELISLGSSPGWGHYMYVVFLGKTLYSYSASLHPSVKMATSELNVGSRIPSMGQ